LRLSDPARTMAKTKTTSPKDKPVWQLSRRGVYGGLVLAACAWTFFLGVLVGRGTAPVHFDMEKLGQDLQALRERVQDQQARQLQTYSDAVESKSDLDFYEDLKASGENLAIDPALTRSPPQPTMDAATEETAEPATPSDIPVKRRMPGLQPKQNAVVRPPRPEPKAAEARPAAAEGAFTLQVASLRDPQMADEMVARLRRQGYQVVRSGVTIPGKGRWYRVQVGRFSDRQAADATIRALESKGLKPILVSR
jgi:cell division septation protein DedD